MRIKTAAVSVGAAFISIANEVHNQQVRTQIAKIDEDQTALRSQLTRLEQERSDLNAQLV